MMQKEQLKWTEQENLDVFWKMTEDHVISGILTAKTNWHDYYMKVKDSASYNLRRMN